MNPLESTIVSPRKQSSQLPSIRLDLEEGCLWKEGRRIDLSPRPLQLIRYLAERPGQLLSKQELIEAVWPDTIVTEASLNQAIRELRKILGDDAKSPNFVETVHRRGFRFIAESAASLKPTALPTVEFQDLHTQLFGRDAELALLDSKLDLARSGKRQIIFVTGEAGIGKTALVRK